MLLSFFQADLLVRERLMKAIDTADLTGEEDRDCLDRYIPGDSFNRRSLS